LPNFAKLDNLKGCMSTMNISLPDSLKSFVDEQVAKGEAFSAPVTDEQRNELRARFGYHRANPDEEAASLVDIKAKRGLT